KRSVSDLVLLSEVERRRRAALPEVEAALLEDPGVENAVALIRPAASAPREIVAYVVAPRGTPTSLPARLAARLPAELLPVACVPIVAIPRTPAGAVDERALRRLDLEGTAVVEAAPP